MLNLNVTTKKMVLYQSRNGEVTYRLCVVRRTSLNDYDTIFCFELHIGFLLAYGVLFYKLNLYGSWVLAHFRSILCPG